MGEQADGFQSTAVEGVDALPVVPPATSDDRPSTISTVRMVAMPCALLVLGAVFFVLGWTVPGVVACVLAVLLALVEVAIGWVVIKFALRAHANMFKVLAPLLRPEGSACVTRDLASLSPEEERAEKAVDRAVGFGLTRAAAYASCENKTPEERDRLRTNVLAERDATYAWLQGIPAWERVATTAEDGIGLVAQMLVTQPDSGRWAVLCHGYAGTWNSMLQYARHWSEAGYNLLVPHMRAHGESGGAYIGMGHLDRRDVVAWMRWLAAGNAGVPCTAIVLFGHSMGGSSVDLASGEADLPAQVRAVVSDCSFDGSWHALASVLQTAGAPVHPTLDLVRLNMLARRGGYDIAKGDVAAAVARTEVPRLFVHGLADPTVPPYMARVLYEAAAGPKRVVAVPGAGHCQASVMDPEGYWDAVLGFAEEHVENEGAAYGA